MTALYAVLAIIIIGGILVGAYLIGFVDGVTAEQMRQKKIDYVILNIVKDINGKETDRHAITHADLAQLEQEAINKSKQD